MNFCLAQKLTRKLQLVLGEDPPKPTETSPRTKSASDTLEAAFEWDRIRRSAAPSPELLPGDGPQQVHTRTGNSEFGECHSGEGDEASVINRLASKLDRCRVGGNLIKRAT
ncbi:hypothetical protein N7453_009673 [Penicillium expansum]|nr:hypothetical protein N7453_009673 [Penicillium expansum]